MDKNKIAASLIKWAHENADRYHRAKEHFGIVIDEDGTPVVSTCRKGTMSTVFAYYVEDGALSPAVGSFIFAYHRRTGKHAMHFKADEVIAGRWANGALEQRIVRLIDEHTVGHAMPL